MSGDFVIGIIVFVILITVNFVVITKGATRIAEVGARFTLDAIPGKQMAIDADLICRPHRRQGGTAPPPRAGGGERLLRLHGRRLQVRARRRHRRPHHHRRQHLRRHRHRRDAPRHVARPPPPTCSPSSRSATASSRRSRRSSSRSPPACWSRRAARAARPTRRCSASSATIRAPCCWPALPCSCWRSCPACRFVPFAAARLACCCFIAYTIPKRRAEAPRRRGRPRCTRPTLAAEEEARLSVKDSLKTAEIELCLGKQLSTPLLTSHGELAQRVAKMRRKFAEPVRLRRPRDQAHRRSRHPAQELPDQDPRHGRRHRGAAHRRRARRHRRRPPARRARRGGARAGLRHEGHVGSGDVRRRTSSARASRRSTTCRCCSPI